MVDNYIISIPKVSVIVPVYKTEQFLDKCINCLINSTLKEIEIILVDDGSPDNSPKICDYYATKDSRIKVIHQQNGGLSNARNVGINAAQGEYICFIDSDDFVSPDMFDKMYNLSETHNLDIASCGYSKVDLNGNIISLNPHPYSDLILSKPEINKMLESAHKTQVIWYVWRNMYKKRIILENNIFFNEELKFAEDSIFNLYSFAYAKRIGVLEDLLYFYRDAPNSLTSRKGKTYLEENLIRQYCEKKEYYKMFQIENLIKSDLKPYIVEHQLPMLLSNAMFLDDKISKFERIRGILKLEMIRDSLKDYDMANIRKLPRGIQLTIILSKLELLFLLSLLFKKK